MSKECCAKNLRSNILKVRDEFQQYLNNSMKMGDGDHSDMLCYVLDAKEAKIILQKLSKLGGEKV